MLPSPGPEIPVILQVASVKLQQLLFILGQTAGRGIGQPFGQGSPKVVAVDFEVFIVGELFVVTHFSFDL